MEGGLEEDSVVDDGKSGERVILTSLEGDFLGLCLEREAGKRNRSSMELIPGEILVRPA